MPKYDDYAKRLESLRHTAHDSEYWLARELQPLLAYSTWENFSGVVARAVLSCKAARVPVENHFRETTKLVNIGSGGRRETADWFLSRYACYLVAMNADPSKEEVAHAQTYFTLQTRRQEHQDSLTATERRRELRDRVKDANKGLNAAAHDAGVVKFGVFHDAGYKALYGGLGKPDIQKKKGIAPSEDLLDCIGHAELAANYFRITQTQQKIERDGVTTERLAIETHKQVGSEVRTTMQRISGTKPEDLPGEPSLKSITTKEPKGLLD